MLDSPDFIPLLRAAQRGEGHAREALLSLLRPFIEDLARGYADPAHAVESTGDLVQEAWLRAWQKLDQFDGQGSEAEATIRFRAWITRIVRRLGANARRDRAARKRHPVGRAVMSLDRGADGDACGRWEPSATQTSPSQRVERSEDAERVLRALSSVPDPEAREILRLRFLEELPLTEAAARLGVSYDRARGLFAAGLRDLEDRLEMSG